MTESLCRFDYLQFGPMLVVHASILLMNADWSGTVTDYDQRPHWS